MNKKILMFAMFGILALGLGTAALIQYFGQIQRDVTIVSAIDFDGESSAQIEISGGESVISELLGVSSRTSVVVPLSIETEVIPNDAGIVSTVEYILDNTGGTCPGEDCEKRIAISGQDVGVYVLSDLDTMSWNVNALGGYVAHVDVVLDFDGD